MTGKIGLNHTEFCTRQIRGLQIVQTFSLRVKPQTEKFLVLDEHSHIEYVYYLKKLCMFSQRVKPQTTKFLVLDEHSHIEYMDYLKKLRMFQYV